RRHSNALLMLADEAHPGRGTDARVADPHGAAAKPLLMMAETMRDATGAADGYRQRWASGERRFGW
ncbi:MAG: hypothetical protein M3Y78_01770, partial [Pseudomonadota bacterium]|nr:hypothetical protein [Pseudomonadota bacterium]